MSTRSTFKHIKSKADLSLKTAESIYLALKEALQKRGTASLMVSGGSSPLPVYEALSKMELDWKNVHIGLVDDRWVGRDSDGSNAASIQKTLFQNKAVSAKFIDLKTSHNLPKQSLETTEKALKDVPYPFDVCVMGMGTDGHTASWFPNSKGLKAALDNETNSKVCAIDATDCPGAGLYPHRISLTLPAVMNSKSIILYIPGPEKLTVFEGSAGLSIFDAPVNALRFAGARLTVFSGTL